MFSSTLKFVKRVLGDPLTDLGSLEGDYRFSNLRGDITQSLVYMVVVGLSVIVMSFMDAAFFIDHPNLLRLMILYRLMYIVTTLFAGVLLYKADKVRTYDRLSFVWIFFTIVFLILFNFMRPQNYLSTSIDVIVPFALYMLSPLKVPYTFALALGFTLGTVYVDYFFKIGVDPVVLNVATYAQIVAHVLGVTFAIQFQSYRRKSYRAYIDEKDAREVAAYLANIDHLTHSMTRRQFMNLAEVEYLRFKRYRRALSILVIDADRFKQINDTYGHHAGDMTLRSLSLVAMEQKRAQDIFGRLGGEEFGLMMPETTMEQALIVAERIRHVWELSPVTLDGELIHSTMSIGVAQAVPGDKSLEDLLRRADRMLYKAKNAGRNRVTSE